MTDSALDAITPNRYDEPLIGAVHYLRTALLGDPDVTRRVLDLADLRDEARGTPRGTRERWQRWCVYWQARDKSPLREQFSARELDDMAATVRELIDADAWGLLVPWNGQGAGFGRRKARARTMSAATIEQGVADLVGRLRPEPDRAELEEGARWQSCPHCDALPGAGCDGGAMHAARLRACSAARTPGVSAAAVRKVRQRVRQLPRL